MKGSKRKKWTSDHGFTLVELVVAMAISVILLSLSAVGASSWMRYSNFKRCEEAAKTTFLAMQSALADLDAQGQIRDGLFDMQGMNPVELSYLDSMDLCYVSVNEESYQEYLNGTGSEAARWLYDNLGRELADLSLLSGSGGSFMGSRANLIVEFDKTSKKVYSVFYAAWADSLTYTPDSVGGTSKARGVVSVNSLGSASSRSPSVREALGLGYYSALDKANVAELGATKLRINNPMLINDEELYLEFSSNVAAKEETVVFSVDLYTSKNAFICHIIMDTSKMGSISSGFVSLPVCFDAASRGEIKSGGSGLAYAEYYFPVRVKKGGIYEIVLDAMSDGRALATLAVDDMLELTAADGGDAFRLDGGARSLTYSIRRLLSAAGMDGEGEYPDIYAAVQAFPNGTSEEIDYSASAQKTSNIENCLYENARTAGLDGRTTVSITKFRHLYNIRYYQESKGVKEAAELGGTPVRPVDFRLMEDLTWSSDKPLYANLNGSIYLVSSACGEFPSIPEIRPNWTLDGNGFAIISLAMGESSSCVYEAAGGGGAGISLLSLGGSPVNRADKLALVLENRGTIQKMSLRGVTVRANVTSGGAVNVSAGHTINAAGSYSGTAMPELHMAAALCAKNSGVLSDISIGPGGQFQQSSTVTAAVSYDPSEGASPSGVALVAAYMTDRSRIAQLSTSSSQVVGYIAAGAQTGKSSPDGAALRAGVGGLVGYAVVPGTEISINGKQDASLFSTLLSAVKRLVSGTTENKSGITNGADVTGNLQVGGVIGGMVSELAEGTDLDLNTPQVYACINTGLILCSEDVEPGAGSDNYTAYGMFNGGIVGYASRIIVRGCTSYPSSAKTDAYSGSGAREQLKRDCKGWYVGGIVGYMSNGFLSECTTGSGGYVVGGSYVGGIVGGLNINGSEFVQDVISNQTSRTTNACYVVGMNYVGGIVGLNGPRSIVQYCTNTGVVGGYGYNIGGIVGANLGSEGSIAIVTGCTSYAYDYDNSMYELAVEKWQADGKNSGGVVGYNEYGLVEYSDGGLDLQKENTMAAIVVGGDNVGGVIGLNGPHGDLALDGSVIRVIGGRVYGYGDNVGGLVGANFSSMLFFQNRTSGGSGSMFTYENTTEPAHFVVQPYSIIGRRCVGGVIGANLVAGEDEGESLWEDEKSPLHLYLQTNNANASVVGTSVVGGLVGYQQILQKRADLLTLAAAVYEVSTGGTDPAADFLTIDENGARTIRYACSKNTVALVERGESDSNGQNLLDVQGYIYLGGIIGLNADESPLILKGCVNHGNVSMPEDPSVFHINMAQIPLVRLSAIFGSDWTAERDALASTAAIAGSIISYNMRYSVVDNCTNTGWVMMENPDQSMLGGVVGVNEGYVLNCSVSNAQGTRNQSFVGGIVSYNRCVEPGVTRTMRTAGVSYSFIPATVRNCEVVGNYLVSGLNCVGGLAALNGEGAQVIGCTTEASIDAAGSCAGGLVGENSGTVVMTSMVKSGVQVSADGENVGGLVGLQVAGGVRVEAGIEATAAGVSVTGANNVGGLVGMLRGGTLNGTAAIHLVNRADVMATSGCAGGIAGSSDGSFDLSWADNYGSVSAVSRTAAPAFAGGVISETYSGSVISSCRDYGSVSAVGGYAAGIAYKNVAGSRITDCLVRPAEDSVLYIISDGDEVGALCTVNEQGAEISNCTVGGLEGSSEWSRDSNVIRLSGQAVTLGCLTGQNGGEIRDCYVFENVFIPMDTRAGEAQGSVIGGIAGENLDSGVITSCWVEKYFDGGDQMKGTVETVLTDGLISRVTAPSGKGFRDVQYLGGVAGWNEGTISACTYSGAMIEAASTEGDAYGGIAGRNEAGEISGCSVSSYTLSAAGAASFTQAHSADVKLSKCVSAGGIAGANVAGSIVDCVLGGRTVNVSQRTYLYLKDGMLGGITGYNSGTILRCGEGLLNGMTWEALKGKMDTVTQWGAAEGNGNWTDGAAVTASALFGVQFTNAHVALATEGTTSYLGGLVGMNHAEAQISDCATGAEWSVFHNADNGDRNSTGGGCLAMNEQAAPIRYLINQADVYKSHFQCIGGITCRQEVQTTDAWLIEHCYNFGRIMSVDNTAGRTGGLVGNVKFYGGTISDCHNYGDVIDVGGVNLSKDPGGFAGGILGDVNQLDGSSMVAVVNSTNHGHITAGAATAGIFGIDNKSTSGWVKLLNCANYGEITSRTNGAGIAASTKADVKVSVQYCQNYGKVSNTSSGSAPVALASLNVSASVLENSMSVVRDQGSWLASKVGSNTVAATDLLGSSFILDGTVKTAAVDEMKQITSTRIFWRSKGTAEENDIVDETTNEDCTDNKSDAVANRLKTGAYYDDLLGHDNRLDYRGRKGHTFNWNKEEVVLEVLFKKPVDLDSLALCWGCGSTNRRYTYHVEYQEEGSPEWKTGTGDGWNTVTHMVTGANTYAADWETAFKLELGVEATAMRVVIEKAEGSSGSSWSSVIYCIISEMKIKDSGGNRYMPISGGSSGDSSVTNYLTNIAEDGGLYQYVGGSAVLSYGKGPEDVLASQAASTGFYWNYVRTAAVNAWTALRRSGNTLNTPGNVKFTSQSGTNYALSWSASEYAAGYEVALYEEGVEEPLTKKYVIGATTASFNVSGIAPGSRLTGKVRAIAHPGVEIDSAWGSSDPLETVPALDTPDLMILAVKGDSNNRYRVRLTTATAQAYAGYAQAGVKFTIYMARGSTRTALFTQNDFFKNGTLIPADQLVEKTVTISESVSDIFTFYAAVNDKGGTSYTDSATRFSMTTVSMNTGNMAAKGFGTVTVSGSTSEDMSLAVVINGRNTTSGGEYSPLYRVELMGVEKYEEDGTPALRETVVAAQNVVPGTNNSVITFSNLPPSIMGYTAVYVRMWLAESGRGPVYYYDPYEEPDQAGSMIENAWVSTGVDGGLYCSLNASGQIVYKAKSNVFYTKTVTLPKELTPVKLDYTPGELVGSSDGTNRMSYHFSWTGDTSADSGKYRVTVYAGSEAQGTILYPADGTYAEQDGTELTVYSDSWTADQVTVRVIQLPAETSQKIGTIDVHTFDIRRHLQRITQPAVTLNFATGQNELLYRIAWQQKDGEFIQTGMGPDTSQLVCMGYEVYAQRVLSTEPEVLGEPVLLGSVTNNPLGWNNAPKPNIEADLERFAGGDIYLYVVAVPSVAEDKVAETGLPDGSVRSSDRYTPSLEGIKYMLSVPARLAPPRYWAAWLNTESWLEPPAGDYPGLVEEVEYNTGALLLETVVQEENRLSGSYLLNGFVFKRTDSDLDELLGGHMYGGLLEKEEKILRSERILAAIRAGQWKLRTGLTSVGVISGTDDPLLMSYRGAGGAVGQERYTAVITTLKVNSAGMKLAPLLRATANTDISSWWTLSEDLTVTLPMIKLAVPSVSSESLTYTETNVNAEYSSGQPISGLNVDITRSALKWTGRSEADSYTLRLLDGENAEVGNYRAEYRVDGSVFTMTLDWTGHFSGPAVNAAGQRLTAAGEVIPDEGEGSDGEQAVVEGDVACRCTAVYDMDTKTALWTRTGPVRLEGGYAAEYADGQLRLVTAEEVLDRTLSDPGTARLSLPMDALTSTVNTTFTYDNFTGYLRDLSLTAELEAELVEKAEGGYEVIYRLYLPDASYIKYTDTDGAEKTVAAATSYGETQPTTMEITAAVEEDTPNSRQYVTSASRRVAITGR